MSDRQTKELLCELLRVFYTKGWVSGTGGGIAMISTGTLTLSGVNTYAGATVVSGPVFIPKIYNGKDKTFFSFAFEHYRESSPSPRLVVTGPRPGSRTSLRRPRS